jgi:hypothetical protein
MLGVYPADKENQEEIKSEVIYLEGYPGFLK